MTRILDILIVVGIIAVVALGLFKTMRKRELPRLVAPKGLPPYRCKPIMSENEKEFFGRLCVALPGCFIFSQVSMAGLIEPGVSAGDPSYLPAFRKISQLRIDYVIYDANLALVCVVELDDRTHNARKDADRDAMLRSAGIRTVRWNSKNKPLAAEIVRTIMPPKPAEI